MRSTKGDGGVPSERMRTQAYPGARLALPNVDMLGTFEQASGMPLKRVPTAVLRRDPLRRQPARQLQRAAAVQAICPSVAAAWADVLHNNGQRYFVPCFRMYISFR